MSDFQYNFFFGYCGCRYGLVEKMLLFLKNTCNNVWLTVTLTKEWHIYAKPIFHHKTELCVASSKVTERRNRVKSKMEIESILKFHTTIFTTTIFGHGKCYFALIPFFIYKISIFGWESVEEARFLREKCIKGVLGLVKKIHWCEWSSLNNELWKWKRL